MKRHFDDWQWRVQQAERRQLPSPLALDDEDNWNIVEMDKASPSMSRVQVVKQVGGASSDSTTSPEFVNMPTVHKLQTSTSNRAAIDERPTSSKAAARAWNDESAPMPSYRTPTDGRATIEASRRAFDDERQSIEPRAPKIRRYLEEKAAVAAASSSLVARKQPPAVDAKTRSADVASTRPTVAAPVNAAAAAPARPIAVSTTLKSAAAGAFGMQNMASKPPRSSAFSTLEDPLARRSAFQ